MNIAILTLPLHVNYGGILQCYALQTVLNRMGHKVQVLTKPVYKRSYYWIYPLAVCKRLLKRYLLGRKITIWKTSHELIRQHTDRFIRKYIHQYIRRNWTAKTVQRFDAVVVGSDQIWRAEYCRYFTPLEVTFLNFTQGCSIKRIAYAASFGMDRCFYSPEQMVKCALLLQQFDAVSVREFSGINICRQYLGVEACQMIDPTLLLQAGDYIQLIHQAETKPWGGDLLAYILDETKEKEKVIESVATSGRFKPFWVNSKAEEMEVPLEERIKIPVEQWLRGFQEAKMVVTDSFHGCVFSIIFKKNFIVIGNTERGMARFISLLQLLGLENRLIHSWEEYQKCKEELLKPIDYLPVDSKNTNVSGEIYCIFKAST